MGASNTTPLAGKRAMRLQGDIAHLGLRIRGICDLRRRFARVRRRENRHLEVGGEYMHAALQLESGKWTSKMGPDEDIEHDAPENLAGPCFGQVTAFMKRKRLLAV